MNIFQDMKILIIGNRYHQFICNYVKAIKINGQKKVIVVDVISQEYSKVFFQTDYLYDNIHILNVPSLFRKCRFVRILIQQFTFRRKIKKLNSYDIVHIHYVENIILRNASYFSKNIKGKLVISIWGSDFLRASNRKKKTMAILFNRADQITIASDNVIEYFQKYYHNSSFLSKVVQCNFGLQPLENIISVKNTGISVLDSKKIIGLSNKIIVTIGYNASRLQYHIDIIKNIENNLSLLCFKEKIEFVLPLTYPIDLKYLREINSIVSTSMYQYKVLENYLSDNEVAHLRRASDIFIQLQPTDMLSGSMLEHLCAGNIIITGEWLPYSCLDNWGIYYKKIDKRSSISTCLYDTLNHIEEYKDCCIKNPELIIDKFRWKNVVKDWINIYKA